MTVLAETKDIVANVFNGSIALLLFVLMPVLITLAYKYNQFMDKKAKETAAPAEPEKIAEAAVQEPEPAAEQPMAAAEETPEE